ncbi:MAG: hypothetical protein ACI85Q_002192 [Salibacteraceae bacterium]|jgi:hypothetical protein
MGKDINNNSRKILKLALVGTKSQLSINRRGPLEKQLRPFLQNLAFVKKGLNTPNNFKSARTQKACLDYTYSTSYLKKMSIYIPFLQLENTKKILSSINRRSICCIFLPLSIHRN